MPRNRVFSRHLEPLGGEPSLSILKDETTGAVRCLNPTQAQFECIPAPTPQHGSPTVVTNEAGSADKPAASAIQYKWTSRNNRKGRHAIIIHNASLTAHDHITPQSTAHWRSIRHTLWLMLTYYPVWDISWCVAFAFTWGSALWVLNGLFIFLPFVRPLSTFPGQVLVGGGVSACVGATVFELGSILLFLEAVNEDRAGCFGWGVEQVWREYVEHDLGFIASASELVGTTVFWVPGFIALPGIIDVLPAKALYVVYWFPLILGGVFFVLSGFLFMIETQKHWWHPAPKTLGWWIGLLNFVGGIGFLLSPCFGLLPYHWAQYQAACISLWASACFLLGSAIQWYESMQKSPVEVKQSA